MSKIKSALMAAVAAKDILGLQEVLRQPGVDVNEKDRDGRTALILASMSGKLDFVDALLSKGAQVNLADTLGGHTALHFAVQSGQIEIVKRLISGGVEIDPVDNFGNTPLARAVFESRGKGEVIHLLLAAGADRNHKNKSGVSPLDLAKKIANFNVAQFFT
jgi:ankyrin repeat protein